jgi:hypothetical protein
MRELIEKIEMRFAGLGPGGRCRCPECGTDIRHETGEPCNNMKCPKCGAAMGRVSKP